MRERLAKLSVAAKPEPGQNVPKFSHFWRADPVGAVARGLFDLVLTVSERRQGGRGSYRSSLVEGQESRVRMVFREYVTRIAHR